MLYSTNKIKLTFVAISLAILITAVMRYLLTIVFSQVGYTFFEPLSATIYVGAFFGLHFYIDRATQQGKYPWMRSK